MSFNGPFVLPQMPELIHKIIDFPTLPPNESLHSSGIMKLFAFLGGKELHKSLGLHF